jgi:hypothetical protein
MLSDIVIFVDLIKDLPGHVPLNGDFVLLIVLCGHTLEVRQLLGLVVLTLSSSQTVVALHVVLH